MPSVSNVGGEALAVQEPWYCSISTVQRVAHADADLRSRYLSHFVAPADLLVLKELRLIRLTIHLWCAALCAKSSSTLAHRLYHSNFSTIATPPKVLPRKAPSDLQRIQARTEQDPTSRFASRQPPILRGRPDRLSYFVPESTYSNAELCPSTTRHSLHQEHPSHITPTSPSRVRHKTARMSLTNCRFYEEKYPEIDSFVMVNVKQVRMRIHTAKDTRQGGQER